MPCPSQKMWLPVDAAIGQQQQCSAVAMTTMLKPSTAAVEQPPQPRIHLGLQHIIFGWRRQAQSIRQGLGVVPLEYDPISQCPRSITTVWHVHPNSWVYPDGRPAHTNKLAHLPSSMVVSSHLAGCVQRIPPLHRALGPSDQSHPTRPVCCHSRWVFP